MFDCLSQMPHPLPLADYSSRRRAEKRAFAIELLIGSQSFYQRFPERIFWKVELIRFGSRQLSRNTIRWTLPWMSHHSGN